MLADIVDNTEPREGKVSGWVPLWYDIQTKFHKSKANGSRSFMSCTGMV